ncbi:hypothetical protein D3C84_988740 [compost metagenome]
MCLRASCKSILETGINRLLGSPFLSVVTSSIGSVKENALLMALTVNSASSPRLGPVYSKKRICK